MSGEVATLGEKSDHTGLNPEQFTVQGHSPRAAVRCLGCEGVHRGVQRAWVREKTLALALDGVGGRMVVLTLFLSRSHFLCRYLVCTRQASEAGVLPAEGKVKCEPKPRLCGPPGLSPLWILLALPHRQMGIRRQTATGQAQGLSSFWPFSSSSRSSSQVLMIFHRPGSCLPCR